MTNKQFGIRELAERAKQEGAFDLAQGVIDASPPSALVETVRSLPFERFSRYNNKRGVLEFRQAVQSYLASRQWNIPAEHILATSGVIGGITAALLTHCRPGSTVLLPEPFFIGHKLLLQTLGFEPLFYHVPLDRSPDWEDLKMKCRGVQAAIITSPANPTGQHIPPEILASLSEQAAQEGWLLLLDEMYREFIWNESHASDESYKDINLTSTVVLRSFSKTLAIPGWRCGFAVTSPTRVEEMATNHDALYIGGSTIAQHALAEALTYRLADLNKYVADLRTLLLRNSQVLEAAFRAHGMEPLPVPATYYMLLKHGRSSDIAAMEELIEKKIVTTPLNILYSDTSKDTGYIRIHFACSEESADQVRAILTR